MMSSCLALPRECHLKEVNHNFSYLQKYHNTKIIFDPSDQMLDSSAFPCDDWTSTECGVNTKKDLPGNIPVPRGPDFVIREFLDANHASNSITMRSIMGFIVYLNCFHLY